MGWLGFGLFLIFTHAYLWNGNDAFSKKQWVCFVLSLLAVFIGTLLLSLALKGILTLWPLITLPQAKSATLILATSSLVVLMMKFFVVMLCTIFSWIMRFHRSQNAERYARLTPISEKYAPKLLLITKVLASAASVLIFYGIWLA